MPPVKTPPQFAWALRESSGKLAVTAEGVYETFATRREAMTHSEAGDILCRVVILHTNAKRAAKRTKR